MRSYPTYPAWLVSIASLGSPSMAVSGATDWMAPAERAEVGGQNIWNRTLSHPGKVNVPLRVHVERRDAEPRVELVDSLDQVDGLRQLLRGRG